MNWKQELKSQNQPAIAEFVQQEVERITTEIQELYALDAIPWIVGYSGGKDSTATLQLVWNAIGRLPENKRKKKIYVLSTDTLVENPIISAWVSQSLLQIKLIAKSENLPFYPQALTPQVDHTFWVNLIGKGYPAPRQRFRWCTERLKIYPANQFIRNIVRENGETILVLGTRKAESPNRASTMQKHAAGRVRDKLSPNASLQNSLIYTPIEDWSNDAVWLYLHQWKNPWGHSNKELFQIYRGATADNECPLVIDTSTPSCGSSRFGCWVCTLVERDKSMEAMVLNDESKDWMQYLLDFRDELDFRSDEKLQKERNNRDFRRITGAVHLVERNGEAAEKTEVTNVPGPYIKTWREYLLRRLLETQRNVRQKAPPEMQNIELISLSELSEIRRIWLEEKHEFDDALPRIYREVTGDIFSDPRCNAGNGYLGTDEWSILTELCDDSIHLELMNRLLDIERQFQTMSRRTGLYQELEKCCQTNFASKNEALAHARHRHYLKQAAQKRDIDSIKQLIADSTQPLNSSHSVAQPTSWAALKFGQFQSTYLSEPEANNELASPATPERQYQPTGIPHITFTKLILQNFGSYQGRQIFDLAPLSPDCPIVLFGGMNGGGKTTLMDAIRLALYGQRALCSTRGNLSYSDFLSQCANQRSGDEPTYVELAFQQTLNNAPQPTEFRIRRTWHRKDERDRLEILENSLSAPALVKAWDERIEDLFPLGISSLFLFDGEQVKELAAQEELPPLVMGAMRSLLGLELPDRLSADLDIIIARKCKESANQPEQQQLEEIETRLTSLQQEKCILEQQFDACQQIVTATKEKLHQVEEAFLIQGGKIAAEKPYLKEQLQQLQTEAATHQKELRELAAGILPLALIQPLLQQAQTQAQQEVQYQQYRAAQAVLQTYQQRLLEFLPALQLTSSQLSQLQTFIAQEQTTLATSEINLWLEATSEDFHQLTSLLAHGLTHQQQQARECIHRLQDCQSKIDATERYLATAAAPEVYDNLKHQFQKTEARVVEALTQQQQLQKQREQNRLAIARVTQELVTFSNLTIEQKTSENILKAAIKAQETLKEFKKRLKLRKLNQLETLVTECFLYLLHKSNLVHQIQIDRETFCLSLLDSEGQQVPKHRLSAGEKQLLAIALLWGLARASGRQLPVAIDTPLGRLDSSHRNHLVERYFPHASHQVILLSTDTEIREEEVKRLREKGAIAREYLLQYNIEQRYTQVSSGYFW